MEQQIHTVHFKADKKLLDLQNKITEVKVHLPGIELFAKKHAKSFEESIDLSFEAIRKQIQKDKEK